MITVIEEVHEESINETGKIFGLLYNYSLDRETKDSLCYIFTQKNYIFFETMIDMFDYYLYGEHSKSKRSYLPEKDYDKYIGHKIDGKFADHLKWI